MKNAKGKNVWNWIPAFAGMTGKAGTSTGFGTSTSLSASKAGSALILTVVLTSLLAIIGMMFLMAANMDKLTTSAVSVNKELQFAVDSAVAQISQELVRDVPGVRAGEEYYDYPGSEDRWLANLEPDDSDNWPHISDLYGEWGSSLAPEIVPEHKEIKGIGSPADADGDGVADSKWTELRTSPGVSGQPAVTKSGKQIYMAIRIIDNGGMLNANTGYKFDSGGPQNETDGSRLWQINLMGLAERPPATYSTGEDDDLLKARAYYSSDWSDLSAYERDVSWRYYFPEPAGKYTPFDISDELAMRNRFLLARKNLLTQTDIHSRLENWGGEFMDTIWTPVNDSTAFGKWPKRVYDDGSSSIDPNYTYRHIVTTYNFDRIINPAGGIMASVGPDNTNGTYSKDKADSISKALNAAIGDPAEANQITVNLIDYCDRDSDVTDYTPDGVVHYYGFERPCIYISELASKLASWEDTSGSITVTYSARSYAIELYKPYGEDMEPNNVQKWRLRIGGAGGHEEDITNWTGGSQYHVIVIEDPLFTTLSALKPPCAEDPISDDIASGASHQDWPTPPHTDVKLLTSQEVELLREAPAGSGNYITVDSHTFVIPNDPGPTSGICISQSVKRDIHPHKCIRRLWDDNPSAYNLGSDNNYDDPDTGLIQAHPTNQPLTNTGEIGMIFRKAGHVGNADGDPPLDLSLQITPTDTEADVRVNLAVNTYQRIFEHLTVFDPNSDGIDNDGDGPHDATEISTPEYKIAGRININTAPWYVIAQLPWVYDATRTPDYELAKAITDYRDKLNDYSTRAGNSGFGNIGELNLVTSGSDANRIDYYRTTTGSGDLAQPPDFSNGDGAADDFEERDVIFTRISNLVTVRSDVFTAYILVRLGPDGPQKRVIAILDRSDVYPSGGKVKIVALWPVPDAR